MPMILFNALKKNRCVPSVRSRLGRWPQTGLGVWWAASGRGLGSGSYPGLLGAQFFPHMRGGSPGQPLGPWDVTQ